MIRVLIITKLDDTHAIYVKWALEYNGHHADIWHTEDIPSKQTHSLEIAYKDIHWHVTGTNEEISKNHYDIIWYRRPTLPKMPDILHPDDVDNAKIENNAFIQTIWQHVFPNAVWINPIDAAKKANIKLLQLKIASQVGMMIPKTLISNNPTAIKNYIHNNNDNVIYKTLYPMSWLHTNEVRLTYADKIHLKDLPSDAILQSVPGIFQTYIHKQYELRITYFGDQYIAVKIHSQQHAKAIMDWRYAPTKELLLEKTTIPSKLDEYCRAFMKKLGLIFGCFDFIVTPDNNYYFLEINEQGQFLWIEDVNPDIHMLQAFVDFLIQHDTSKPAKSSMAVSLLTKDVLESHEKI